MVADLNFDDLLDRDLLPDASLDIHLLLDRLNVLEHQFFDRNFHDFLDFFLDFDGNLHLDDL